MADPDLELRKGGGAVFFATLPAFLPFAILFILPKKEGRGGGAGLDLPLLLYSFSFPVYSCLLRVLFALLVEVNQACPSLVE